MKKNEIQNLISTLKERIMNNLKVFIDKEHKGKDNSPSAAFRWGYVYAHGDYESENGYDIVLFNQEKPEAGVYLAKAENGRDVLVKLVMKRVLEGRCCYLDDVKGMEYVLRPDIW